MSTHGSIAIRRKQKKDEVFVFHPTHSGNDVKEFMKQHPKPSSIDELILDACRFCSDFDMGYEDNPSVNIYVEEFKPDEKYHDLTHFSVYYDGKFWKHNLEED